MPQLASIAAKLRRAALSYPGAVEAFPWGERVFKVGGKIFAFAEARERTLRVTVKLPHTGAMALLLPFAEPTGYNLGKSGWVSASFTRAAGVPVDMLLDWLDESYRAVAPRRLVRTLPARSGSR